MPHPLLLQLDNFPVFDTQHGLKNMGYNHSLLRDMIQAMVQEIPREKADFTSAYVQQNWVMLETLAHKMNGVAVYFGITKLQHACQYLERGCDMRGPLAVLDLLYQQVIQTCDETYTVLQQWLQDL